MPASFRKIDYSLRPAKHTERRMLSEIFRRLWVFNPLTTYTYVGFGAIAFTDFVLFHKVLGVRNMISIEKTREAIKRIEANKPFSTITIETGLASKILPKLKWAEPHIVWLDYDRPLESSMLLDVGTVANHAASGAAFAVSFQCDQAKEFDAAKEDEKPLDLFVSSFGRDKVPDDTDELDLRGWKFGALGLKILQDEIRSILAARNSSLTKSDQVQFETICTIEYSDNAKMVTLVGIFVANKDRSKFDGCEFAKLDFLPTNGKNLRVAVPILTLREIRDLERQLPLNAGQALQRGQIPQSDAEAFSRFYRYLPNFAVLEN